MRTVEVASEPRQSLVFEAEAQRLSVVVADGSARGLDTVSAVLEFEEIVDLVGRAATFEETIELAVRLRPDLVLMDVEMPSANLAVAAILLSAVDTRMIGISAGDSIPLDAPSLILSFSALLHQSRLREEFLPVLHALYSYPATLGRRSVWPSILEPQPQQVSTSWPKFEVNNSREDS
jgi:DNA-binding NarL/FixJ family response regulator